MMKENRTTSSSFFPLPSLNPLLRSFNIPPPVIYPPGTDPNLFLNPNSHGDDQMKPMPPFDVDPCAASRNEIITRTTDLTASEHTGESVNELCEICCTSYDHELCNHILGKKHQQNLQKTENSLQDPMKEDGKVVIIERCKRKAKASLASEDADSKRRR